MEPTFSTISTSHNLSIEGESSANRRIPDTSGNEEGGSWKMMTINHNDPSTDAGETTASGVKEHPRTLLAWSYAMKLPNDSRR